MEKGFRKAKIEIQAALKDTHTTLFDAKDHPRNKKHIILRPSMAASVHLNPYIKEYIEIDILGKLQPCNIRFSGMKDVFNVYLSTSEAFPDETATIHRGAKQITFSTCGDAKDAKFTRSSLYLCLESGAPAHVKATVAFGPEQSQKVQDEEKLAEQRLADEIKDEFERRMARQKNADEILDTASRNANEHNKRIQILIEKIITNERDAKQFMSDIYAKKRARLDRERAEIKNFRDVVESNKMDAGVWKDLNAFSQAQIQ